MHSDAIPAAHDGEATDANHTSSERPEHGPAATFASRVVALPKLQRQISLVMSHGSPAPQLPSAEEQLKEQRYERMMDRFQLRHVPLARSASSANVLPATAMTHRQDSLPAGFSHSLNRLASTDLASFASGVDTARCIDKRVGGSNVVASPESEGPTHLRSTLFQRSSFRNSFSQLTARLNAERIQRMPPLAPTSIFTRLRLVLVVAIFTIQLVYIPYGIVYYPPDHATTIALDTVVDAVFLLNIVATCNTAVQTNRSHLITSRRAIWRYYRKAGLTMDVLACVPIELFLLVVKRQWLACLVRAGQVVVQAVCLQRHIDRFYRAWKREAIRADKSLIAWILYSRYGHLVRIGGIVFMITLMAHYLACVWSWLLADVDPFFLTANDPLTIHMHSIYDALQLLQGQGLPTTTPAQDFFGSIAVLLGSIALAVVFGHVAILVSNFSANQTSYQRKMERVVAIMSKLQLPHPIRERVHQYYEYLHAEYESLDGEIVKFTKDLSHTLELEVVLFKYMDVLMNVPHWRECSPDFQKQLVLNLSVRVYLPDDYIMRRGEVGTECYIINRGTCKQQEYATGNYEPPTLAMIGEDGVVQPASRRRRSTQLSSQASVAPRHPLNGAGRRQSRYSLPESGRSDADALANGTFSSITELKRGQSIGAMSLLANYERSSDLRAVTYVEMCVIERETFQRILTRYPRDREIVLGSIVRHTMLHLAAGQVPCMLMQMVHDVMPHASVSTGIQMITKAMNPRENDPSIVFGVTEQLASRLHEMAASEMGNGDDDMDSAASTDEAVSSSAHRTPPKKRTHEDESSDDSNGNATRSPSSFEIELLRMVQEMNDRLTRIEERQPTCCHCSHDNHNTPTPVPVASPQVQIAPPRTNSTRAIRKLARRHTVKTGGVVASCPLDLSGASQTTASTGVSIPDESELPTTEPETSSALSAPKRVLQELVGSFWSRATEPPQEPLEQPSPTPWADQLFQTRHQSQSAMPALGDPGGGRRSSLRRTLST